jgi:hypothetical protein
VARVIRRLSRCSCCPYLLSGGVGYVRMAPLDLRERTLGQGEEDKEQRMESQPGKDDGQRELVKWGADNDVAIE